MGRRLSSKPATGVKLGTAGTVPNYKALHSGEGRKRGEADAQAATQAPGLPLAGMGGARARCACTPASQQQQGSPYPRAGRGEKEEGMWDAGNPTNRR